MSENYFLGAMITDGFSTEFGKIMAAEGYFTYILKGGAGTGKSSLMKKVAAAFEENDHVVRYHCSSDPNSLDAIVLKERKAVIVDGTSPHVFDPTVPAVKEKICNLGECWDEKILRENAESIIDVTFTNKSLLARAKRYTTALSNVYFDTYSIGCESINHDKFDAFLLRLRKKLFGSSAGGGSGKTIVSQLSAVTENGYMTYRNTLSDYFDVYYMADGFYAASAKLIDFISSEAVARGYDVILSPNQLFNNDVYEHLLIPSLGIALVSMTPMNEIDVNDGKPVNLMRFYNKQMISSKKPRLKLNRLTCKNLMKETVDSIKSAKAVHDEIEKYYIEAMNFDKVDKISKQIIFEISQR